MKVLVDTCIWSKAFRYNHPDQKIINKMSDLINDGRAMLIGPIKQELLSGIPEINQFNKLKDLLAACEEVPLESKHFVKAAEYCNTCRSKGIPGSTIDFLICSVAVQNKLDVYTDDKDFKLYQKHLPIKLFI